MICISVTPTSRKLAKVDILNACRQADMVEVCVDHLVKEPDLGEMLAGFSKPLLVSCRRPEEGGQWKGSDEQRMALLRQAIISGPDFVELDLETAEKIPRFGKTKRVVAFTSLNRPIGDVEELVNQAANVKADVVKFTGPTPDLDAAWPLLVAVTKKRQLPVVALGLGQAGVTFSLLGQKYGSPWIYAALEPGMEAFAGQTTVWDLDEIYDHRSIESSTRLVGVVGFDTAATETVRRFNTGFRALGLNVRCLPLEPGRPDRLVKQLNLLKVKALILPPAAALRMPDIAVKTEDAAAHSGYVDLLLHQSDGWTGYNLLWRSVLRMVEVALGSHDNGDRPLDRRNVLIIGADRLARAVAQGVQRRKGIVSITSLRAGEAEEAATSLGIRYVPAQALYDTLADVVIFADPTLRLGSRKSEFNPSYLRPGMTVVDITQIPAESDCLIEARQRGAAVVDPAAIFHDLVAQQFKPVAGKDLPV